MSEDAKRFAATRRRLDMTQVELGEALGRTSRQVIAYENGNYGIPRIVWLALAALEHLPPEKRRIPETPPPVELIKRPRAALVIPAGLMAPTP